MAKNEYPCTDVQPIVNYGHDGAQIRRLHTNASGDLFTVSLNEIIPVAFDEVNLTYTGENITGAVYKLDSTTVATLTLTYTLGKLTKVVRT